MREGVIGGSRGCFVLSHLEPVFKLLFIKSNLWRSADYLLSHQILIKASLSSERGSIHEQGENLCEFYWLKMIRRWQI